MKTIVLIFAELLAASLLQVGKAADVPGRVSYEKLQDGPWKIRRWDERYPFVFLTYGGRWSAQDRIAHECKQQSLLTPTWEDPKFAHPIESRATEWGWSMEWRPSGCTTRRECYEKVKRLYLERTRCRQYPGTKDPEIKQGEKFYMLSMQATYLLCGAEWGCDMVGIETGENLGASNVLTTFVRGAAHRLASLFMSKRRRGTWGVCPSSSRATTIPRSTGSPRNRSKRRWGTTQARSPTEGIRRIASPANGITPGFLERLWFALKDVNRISSQVMKRTTRGCRET